MALGGCGGMKIYLLKMILARKNPTMKTCSGAINRLEAIFANKKAERPI